MNLYNANISKFWFSLIFRILILDMKIILSIQNHSINWYKIPIYLLFFFILFCLFIILLIYYRFLFNILFYFFFFFFIYHISVWHEGPVWGGATGGSTLSFWFYQPYFFHISLFCRWLLIIMEFARNLRVQGLQDFFHR